MKKHLLFLSLCMAFTVQVSAQEANGKATRLLSCDYTYDNKTNNQVEHDTYIYTYNANGLPKVIQIMSLFVDYFIGLHKV